VNVADLPPTDPETAIAELRERITELEADLAAERGRSSEASGELTGLRAQLAELQKPTPKGKRVEGFFEVDADE
jgi:chromosome segregation ATPase